MSVFLSKVLSTLVHPLNLALYGLAFALLLRLIGFKRLALVGAVICFAWLYAFSTPFVAEKVFSPWEQQYENLPAEAHSQSDLIVVLGGGMRSEFAGLRAMPDLGDSADRVWHGAELLKAKKAPKILLTGGRLPWHSLGGTEADAMRTFLSALGVNATQVMIEGASQTTYENARLSQPIISKMGVRRAHLVTSGFHMNRSIRVFEKAMPDVEWIPAPTDIRITPRQNSVLRFLPEIDALTLSQMYLRERVGIWVYARRNWL